MKSLSQHVPSVISSVVVALLVWVGVAVTSLQTNGVALAVEIQHLKADVADIKTRVGRLYPVSQAMRDREEVERVRERVRALERGD